MYVTPHRWTSFYGASERRTVIEADQAKWDYRHQVLGTRYLRSWQIFFMVKATELAFQLRPRALWRLLFYRDAAQRRAYSWCVRNAGFVWLAEILEFLFRSTRLKQQLSLRDFAGAHSHEAPLASSRAIGTGRSGIKEEATQSERHPHHLAGSSFRPIHFSNQKTGL
jgi:anaerobic magnesium-protoporphyrin IX monomethyl ester cyclase